MFKKIAIYGLGLLGGSLSRSVKKISAGTEILAFGRNIEKLKPALHEGFVDAIGIIGDADLDGVELIIVSTPVIASIGIIKSILNNPGLGSDAIVVDVGSVKEMIVREIEPCRRADRFVPCHPMAGSEKSGYIHGSETLFKGSSVIITPHKYNTAADIGKIHQFWRELGVTTLEISADLHDKIITCTSHIPHIAACAVVHLLMDAMRVDDTNMLGYFIGRGFRDVTRISAGSPDVWYDICRMNYSRISESIDLLIERLIHIRRMISDNSEEPEALMRYFEKIRNYRENL